MIRHLLFVFWKERTWYWAETTFGKRLAVYWNGTKFEDRLGRIWPRQTLKVIHG